jgi:exosortase D (VPLPA-CTERM-specific)
MMSVQSLAFPKTGPVRAWILGCMAALLAAIAFRGALFELVRRWTTQEEYSHGFLVPLVAAWLLWVRRDALLASIAQPAWTGPALILLAMFMHVIGQLGGMFVLSPLAFIVTLLGIILATGGFPLLRVAFIPTAFLIFAIPLPSFIQSYLSIELQLISSRLGVAFISFFQIPVYLEGNLIDLGSYKLQVVDACSGLRYLFPLFSLSFLTVYLFQAPVWQRALVLFSSIPITIAMNGFRIGIVGVTVDRWGPRMADGVLHFFEGWIIFVASALLLALEVILLARISGRRFSEVFGFPTTETVQGSAHAESEVTELRQLYACLVLICVTMLVGSLTSNRPEIIPERSRFVTFPAKIGNWQGNPSLLEPQVEQFLAMDDYLLSDYSNPDGKIVNLYAAYYASERSGKLPHSPLDCIPGDGWSITKFERTSVDHDRPINRATIERNGSKQLVYYWYEKLGKRITTEYFSKYLSLYDAITERRSDGALVRLTTPIRQGEPEHDADARLRQFMHDLGPTLTRFLPSADMPKTTAVEQSLGQKIRNP